MESLLENNPNGSLNVDHASFESELGELRLGRRLKKLTSSVENFLQIQLSRLNTALRHCEKAEEQNELLRRMMAEFETQKREWQLKQLAEEQRLFEAGEKLMRGWEQLEIEKQKAGLG